jgi:hypothetical protein
MILVVAIVPIILIIAIRSWKLRRASQARRIEDYKTSPESHLLHLND